ncbi:MAG: methyltransferase domain-containing protein [Paracoccaceae bacterium]
MRNPDLGQAYSLDGAESCRTLYADWAETYDAGFAEAMGYRLPDLVAQAFVAAMPPEGAVLDVGAGTGLLAEALRSRGWSGPIDAVDLSAAMLSKARDKGHYRALFEADVTHPLNLPGRYAGIVSSGTFTHGHVGPEAFGPLLSICVPGAVLALSVNAGIWDELGFADALAALGSRVAGITLTEAPIYGDGALQRDPEHAKDRAMIVTVRLS